MGAAHSTINSGDHAVGDTTVFNSYDEYATQIYGPSYTGGGPALLPDDATIEEIILYLNDSPINMSQKVKEDLIKRIGTAVKKFGANVDMTNCETIVSSLKKYLPNPSEGTTIRGDNKQMDDIAKEIASILNAQFSVGSRPIIDTANLTPQQIVKEVSTNIYGISCGMNIEFYKIYNILKTQQNRLDTIIGVANQVLEDRSRDAANSAQNAETLKNIEILKESLQAALGQIKIINNIIRNATGNLATSETELKAELEKLKGKYDQIVKYEAYDGDEYGDVLAKLLSTIGNTAYIAATVKHSLSKVGMDLKEYKNFDNVSDMINKVNKSITSLNPVKDADKITDLMYHADELTKFFGRRKEFTGGITAMQKGEFNPGGFTEGGDSDEFSGGAIITSNVPDPLLKAEAKGRLERAKIALRNFVNKINKSINTFIEISDSVAMDLGRDPSIDYELAEDFIDRMSIIEEIREPNLYLAMVGYYLDDSYRQRTTIFNDNINALRELLLSYPSSNQSIKSKLTAMADTLSELIKQKDFFSDLVKTLFSGIARFDVMLIITDIPNTIYSIEVTRRKLIHSIYISRLKQNMRDNAPEMDVYSKKYPEMVSFAIGEKRRKLSAEEEIILYEGTKPLTANNVGMSILGPSNISEDVFKSHNLMHILNEYAENTKALEHMSTFYKNAASLNTSTPEGRKHQLFREFVQEEYRAKHRLYKAVESLDILLTHFSKEVVTCPDIVKQVRKFVDDTKVYTKWFTEYTGDNLAKVFEHMPCGKKNEWVGDITPNIKDDTELLQKYLDFLLKHGNSSGSFMDVPGTLLPHMFLALNTNAKAYNGTPVEVNRYIAASLGMDNLKNEYSGIADEVFDKSSYYRSLEKKIIEKGRRPVFGRATGVANIEELPRIKRAVDEYYNNFQALNNIFHAFVTLYNHLIENKVKALNIMSPYQIYYSILSYLKTSAVARKYYMANPIPNTTNYETNIFGVLLPGYHFDNAIPAIPDGIAYERNITDRYERELGVRGGAGLRFDPKTAKMAFVRPGSSTRVAAAPRPPLTGEEDSGMLSSLIRPPLTTEEDSGMHSSLPRRPSLHRGESDMHSSLIRPPLTEEEDLGMLSSMPRRPSLHRGESAMHVLPPAHARFKPTIASSPRRGEGLSMLRHASSPVTLTASESASSSPTRKTKLRTRRFSEDDSDPLHTNKHRKYKPLHYRSVYEDEDAQCALAIKAVVSSVLSLAGLSFIESQPANVGVISGVRSITGGAVARYEVMDENIPMPEVLKTGFEIYYYVPRIAEFYRLMFNDLAKHIDPKQAERGGIPINDLNYSLRGANNTYIGLPKDMIGNFGKLMYIVMDKPKDNPTSFTETEVKSIITELNKVYAQYATTKEPVRAVIKAFIREVNRRFSIISDEDIRNKMYLYLDRLKQEAVDEFVHSDKTGEMAFAGQSTSDSDIRYLDSLITPSDALAKQNLNSNTAYTMNEKESRVYKDALSHRLDLGGTSWADPRTTLPNQITHPHKVGAQHIDAWLGLERVRLLRAYIDDAFDEVLVNDEGEFKLGFETFDLYKRGFFGKLMKNIGYRMDILQTNEDRFALASKLVKDMIEKDTGDLYHNMLLSETVITPCATLYATLNLVKAAFNDMAVFEPIYFLENFGNSTPKLTQIPFIARKLRAGLKKLWETSNGTAPTANAVDFNKFLTQKGIDIPVGVAGVINVDTILEMIFPDQTNDINFNDKNISPTSGIFYLGVCYALINNIHALNAMGAGYYLAKNTSINSISFRDTFERVFGRKKSIFETFKDIHGNISDFESQFSGSDIAQGKLDSTEEYNRRLKEYIIKNIINCLDQAPIMATIMGSLTRLASSLGNLVKVDITSQNILLDITALKNLIKSVILDTKRYIEILRLRADKDTLTQYEKIIKSGKVIVNPYCIYNLENEFIKLFDRYFENENRYSSLIDRINENNSTIYRSVLSSAYPKSILGGGSAGVGTQRIEFLQVNRMPAYNNLGQLFIAAIMPPHTELTPLNATDIAPTLNSLLLSTGFGKTGATVFAMAGQLPHGTAPVSAENYVTNVSTLYGLSNSSNITSIIPALNYGIASMLKSFFESGSRKIYAGIVNKILATKLGACVDNLELTYPDMIDIKSLDAIRARGAVGQPDINLTGKKDYIQYPIPKPDALLTYSLALTLRHLYVSVDEKTKEQAYLYTSLSDIRSKGLLEVYKVKLPIFCDYFEKLVYKCKMLRALISRSTEHKHLFGEMVLPPARSVATMGSASTFMGGGPTGGARIYFHMFKDPTIDRDAIEDTDLKPTSAPDNMFNRISADDLPPKPKVTFSMEESIPKSRKEHIPVDSLRAALLNVNLTHPTESEELVYGGAREVDENIWAEHGEFGNVNPAQVDLKYHNPDPNYPIDSRYDQMPAYYPITHETDGRPGSSSHLPYGHSGPGSSSHPGSSRRSKPTSSSSLSFHTVDSSRRGSVFTDDDKDDSDAQEILSHFGVSAAPRKWDHAIVGGAGVISSNEFSKLTSAGKLTAVALMNPGDFTRYLSNRTNNYVVPLPQYNYMAMEAKGVISDAEFYANMDSEQRYAYFTQIINNLEEVCIQMVNLCQNLSKEIPFESSYMNFSDNQAQMEVERGITKFAPLSLMTVYGGPTKISQDTFKLDTTIATDEFKLQYAARSLLFTDLSKIVNEKYFASPLSILDMAQSGKQININKTNYIATIKDLVSLTRFNYSMLGFPTNIVRGGIYSSNKFSGGGPEYEPAYRMNNLIDTSSFPNTNKVLNMVEKISTSTIIFNIIPEDYANNYDYTNYISVVPAMMLHLYQGDQSAFVKNPNDSMKQAIKDNLTDTPVKSTCNPHFLDRIIYVFDQYQSFLTNTMTMNIMKIAGSVYRTLVDDLIDYTHQPPVFKQLDCDSISLAKIMDTFNYATNTMVDILIDINRRYGNTHNISSLYTSELPLKAVEILKTAHTLNTSDEFGDHPEPLRVTDQERELIKASKLLIKSTKHRDDIFVTTYCNMHVGLSYAQDTCTYLQGMFEFMHEQGYRRWERYGVIKRMLADVELTTALDTLANIIAVLRNFISADPRNYPLALACYDLVNKALGALIIATEIVKIVYTGGRLNNSFASKLETHEWTKQLDNEALHHKYSRVAIGLFVYYTYSLSILLGIAAPAHIPDHRYRSLAHELGQPVYDNTHRNPPYTLDQNVYDIITAHMASEPVRRKLDDCIRRTNDIIQARGVPRFNDKELWNNFFRVANILRVKGGAAPMGKNYFDLYTNLVQTVPDISYVIYTYNNDFTVARMLDIVNGTNRKESAMYIVTNMIKKKKESEKPKRHTETAVRILLELNLNPINYYSLMRLIPLSNIYNYAASLDRLIYANFNLTNVSMASLYRYQDLTIKNVMNNNKLDSSGNVPNNKLLGADLFNTAFNDAKLADSITKTAFLKMIINPYCRVDAFMYGIPTTPVISTVGPIGRIMRGVDCLGMGTPKFISDQLLQKVLLNSVYSGSKLGDMGVSTSYGANQYLNGKDVHDIYSYTHDERTREYTTPHGAPDAGLQSTYVRPGNNNQVLEMLTYYDKNTKGLKQINLANLFKVSSSTALDHSADESILRFREEGYDRFNTQIVRTSFYICNLQRTMRYMMNLWLNKTLHLVETGHRGVAAEVTERRIGDNDTTVDEKYVNPKWI